MPANDRRNLLERLLRPGSWRLATQVIALTAVLLGALLVIVILGHNDARNERREAEVDNAVAMGQAIAGIIDGFAQDLETTFVAEGEVLRGLNEINQETAGPTLQTIVAQYGILRGLFITDLEGKIIASASGDSIGLDFSDRPYMVTLREGASEVWAPGIAGIETGRLVVTYGRPVEGPDGGTIAFLVAALYPDQLAQRLQGRLPEDADVSIFDSQGTLLHSTARADLTEDQRDFSTSDSVRRALNGEVVRVDGEVGFYHEEERFGAVAPVQTSGWAVAVTRPSGPLNASLQERFRSQAGQVAIAVLVAGGLIAFAVRRIARPLEELATASDRVARGERPEIPTYENRAEVGWLADSMRTMSAAVAEREDALLRESARRSMLAEASRDFADAGLNLDEQLDVTARRVAESIGDGCAILLLLSDGTTLQPSFLHHRSEDAERAGRDILLANPVQVGEGLSGRSAASAQRRELRLQEDLGAARATLTPPHWEYFTSIGTHTLAAVPLIARGRVIGTLTVWRNLNPEPYTDEEYALLQELAYRAALAIENAQLYTQAAEHAQSVERAMSAHEEFMAHVAHDLRNPLTTIRGTAQLLMRQVRDRDERVFSAMQSIDEATSRAMREIDAALDIARLQAGQDIALDVTGVDVVQLLTRIAETQSRTAERHRITVEALDGEIVGEWDGPRLDRAFTNLIDNAIKYSPDGGEVTVTISRIVHEGQEWARVAVRDEGIGIPESALPRVFDRFYRADNTATISGSGLGLSGVVQIIRSHGGTIGVTSEEGAGSVFTVRLPTSRVEEAPTPEPVPD